MSFEYKISFQVADPKDLEAFLFRLRDIVPGTDTSDHFAVTLEADGFYFCDHAKSDVSSRVLRKLIDKGLSQSEEVIVREL